jgi:hypothetical protein
VVSRDQVLPLIKGQIFTKVVRWLGIFFYESETVDWARLQIQLGQRLRGEQRQVLHLASGADGWQAIPEGMPASGLVGGSVTVGYRAVIRGEANANAQDAHPVSSRLCGHWPSPANGSPRS